jgi:hypothetical protein
MDWTGLTFDPKALSTNGHSALVGSLERCPVPSLVGRTLILLIRTRSELDSLAHSYTSHAASASRTPLTEAVDDLTVLRMRLEHVHILADHVASPIG